MSDISFMTAQEAAKVLRVSIMTVYRLIKSGELEANQIGNQWRIKTEEFENFLERNRTSRKT